MYGEGKEILGHIPSMNTICHTPINTAINNAVLATSSRLPYEVFFSEIIFSLIDFHLLSVPLPHSLIPQEFDDSIFVDFHLQQVWVSYNLLQFLFLF